MVGGVADLELHSELFIRSKTKEFPQKMKRGGLHRLGTSIFGEACEIERLNLCWKDARREANLQI
jgi:hypothetical protein